MKIDDVAAFFGSKQKLADALGIFPSAVTQWGKTIPQGRQYQIQVITKGKFKVEQKGCKEKHNA